MLADVFSVTLWNRERVLFGLLIVFYPCVSLLCESVCVVEAYVLSDNQSGV